MVCLLSLLLCFFSWDNSISLSFYMYSFRFVFIYRHVCFEFTMWVSVCLSNCFIFVHIYSPCHHHHQQTNECDCEWERKRIHTMKIPIFLNFFWWIFRSRKRDAIHTTTSIIIKFSILIWYHCLFIVNSIVFKREKERDVIRWCWLYTFSLSLVYILFLKLFSYFSL